MKNIYLAIFLIGITHQAQSQIVNIPDVNFKNALINTLCVDTNGDGVFNADVNNHNEVQISKDEAVFRLNVSSQGITDLEGIEEFINLELLSCSVNQLTNLDFSQNLFFRDLYCDEI